MKSASYDAQLEFLHDLALQAQARASEMSEGAGAFTLHMVMSIAESIKTARDHSLNCPSSYRKK